MRNVSARRPSALLALGALALGGCYVPLSGSAPLGANTVGLGELDVAAVLEYPVIDQLGTATSPPDASSPDRYPRSSAPYLQAQLAWGASHTLDLDIGLVGELQGIIPVPHGAFVGARYAFWRADSVRLGAGAHLGYAGFLASSPSQPFEGSTVTAFYASLTLTATLTRWDRVQPIFGLSVQPMYVTPRIEGQDVDSDPVRGVSAAATVGISVYTITPFASAGVFASDNVRGTAPFWTVGLARGF